MVEIAAAAKAVIKQLYDVGVKRYFAPNECRGLLHCYLLLTLASFYTGIKTALPDTLESTLEEGIRAMGSEILEVLLPMDKERAEVQLALQCSPVLSGLKISNLLIVKENICLTAVGLLRTLGVSFYMLRHAAGRTVFLVYRGRALADYLQSAGVERVLVQCGYVSGKLGKSLPRIASRYVEHMEKNNGFPHEMGVFLGYPVDDVEGFVKNCGHNYLYAGYWKVYSHVEEKKILFSRYNAVIYWFLTVLAGGGNLEECMQERRNLWQKM